MCAWNTAALQGMGFASVAKPITETDAELNSVGLNRLKISSRFHQCAQTLWHSGSTRSWKRHGILYPGFYVNPAILTWNSLLILAEPKSTLKRFYSWFCGYEAGSYEAQKAAQEHKQRMATISSLEQDPVAKRFLDIMLVVILCVGTFLYIYFSV